MRIRFDWSMGDRLLKAVSDNGQVGRGQKGKVRDNIPLPESQQAMLHTR